MPPDGTLPWSTALAASLRRAWEARTQRQAEEMRRLGQQGIQLLPQVRIEAPTPRLDAGVTAARRQLRRMGLSETSAYTAAKEALETASQEEANLQQLAIAKELGRAFIDPRIGYAAGRQVGERIRTGLGELGTEGRRATGARRAGLGAAETALNILPAVGATGAISRLASRIPSPVRPLVVPTATGALGAGVGYATAPEDAKTLGAVAGGFAGGLAGQLGTSAIQARRAATAAAAAPAVAQAAKMVDRGIDFAGQGRVGAALQQAKNIANEGVGDFLYRKLIEAARPIRKYGERMEVRGIVRPSESPATRVNEAYDSPARIKQALGGAGIVSPTTYQVIGPSFQQVFESVAQSPAKVRDAIRYLVSKRIVGRGDEMGLKLSGGVPEQLAAHRTIVEAFGQRPDIAQVESRLNEFVGGLRQYAVDAGLWTQEMADRLASSDALYIPFKRIIETPTGQKVRQMFGGRGRIGGVSAEPRRMTGGTQVLENPAEALADYSSQIIRRADMHRVTESIVSMAERAGDIGELGILTPISAPSVQGTKAVEAARARLMQQGLSEADALKAAEDMTDLFAPGFDRNNPVIWVLRNGEKKYFRVNQPELYEAMMSFGQVPTGAVENAVRAVLGPIKRLITTSATGINVGFFGVTNPARDIPDVIAKNPGAAANLLGGFRESLQELFGRAGLAKPTEFAEQIGRRGGGASSLFFAPQTAGQARRLFAPSTAMDVATGGLGSVAGLPVRAVESLGAATERGPRFAAAKAAYGRTLKQPGMTSEDAYAMAARAFNQGTVDFRPQPGSPVMRFVTDITPFLGASTKGVGRYAEFMAENPGRAAAQAALTMAGTTAEYMYSRKTDREKFVDIIPNERARFLIFGNKRIPLGQEQALIAAMTRVALARIERDDPEAFTQLTEAFTNTLPPFLDVPGVSQAVGLMRNRSYAGPIESERLKALPAEERRYESTPATFTALARSPLIPGSPRQLEYLAKETFGPLTPAVTAITEPIAKRMLGATAPVVEPGAATLGAMNPVRRIVRPDVPFVTAGEQWYYKTRERSAQELTRFRRALESVDLEKATSQDIENAILRAGGTRQNAKMAAASGIFKIFDKQLEQYSQFEDAVRSLPSLTEAQRVDALKRIRADRQADYRLSRKTYQDFLARRRQAIPSAGATPP